MPRTRNTLLLFCAVATLTGCFAPEEPDNPYTRPLGEVFQSLQLEVDRQGDLLVMTRSGMVYEYAGEDPAQAGRAETRNYHSVLYRRAKGSWKATPFRNLQQEWSTFPVLVPDSEGNYHAFIRDARKVLHYRPVGEEWVRVPAGRLESARNVFDGGTDYGAGTLALRGDSDVVFCRWNWGEGIEVHGVAGARGSFFLDTNENVGIHAVRSAPGFIGVLGYKNISSEEDMRQGIYRTRAAYWHWHPDDSAATAVILPDSAYQYLDFVRRGEGLGILLVLQDGFYLLPLSSDGGLSERVLLAGRDFRVPAPDTAGADGPRPGTPQPFHQVEMDAQGCIHLLERRLRRNAVRGVDLYYANSCSRPREEVIPLPTHGLGDSPAESYDVDMHVDSGGTVRVAVSQVAFGAEGLSGPYSAYAPSRILVAELGESGWKVEIVATK